MWLCIAGGMFTLLLAAMSKKNKGQCRDYSITIKGVRNNFFIDKSDVEQLLIKKIKGNIKGQPVVSFNLNELEKMLEHDTWISDAEMYFDNKDILYVIITEREPVARVFTAAGNSFYLDSLGNRMPLSEKMSARVPVFTGFPDKKILSVKDSALLNDVRVTANFIMNDPFWMSQVAQINITPERNFEMSPVVGNHTVKLGNGENISKKFHRLMLFYKQVLSKTGFDKYKIIDVQYAGQVVASKYDAGATIDSVQLRKNVEKLLQQSRDARDDTMMTTIPVTGKYIIAIDSAGTPPTDLPINNEINPERHGNPNPVKSFLPKPVKTNESKLKPPVKKQPKAVMPKKPVEETNGGYN